MSTDPTQPLRAPAPPPEEPEAEAPQTAQPTVKAPAVKAPAPPAPAQPATGWGQEPATQAVPKWQAPAPPPPPAPQRAPQAQPDQAAAPQRAPQARPDQAAAPARPQPPATRIEQQPPASVDPSPDTRWDQRPQATRFDQSPAQWDRPPQRPQPQLPQTQRLEPPPQRPQPPQPQQSRQPQQPPQPQQWEQQRQPSGWTEPRPWVEPQDDRPGQRPRSEPQDDRAAQWAQQPPVQPPVQQAPGRWGQPPAAQGPPGQAPRRGRGRKRRVRRSFMALFTVIVLLILLVIGDRVALAITENAFASQIQQQGLPVKPSVTIDGFPFLTQLAAKDFNQVNISASNVPVSLPTGGTIQITSINATIHGMHISSFSSSASARVDQMNATVFVSFGALAAAGGIGGGTGITVTPAGKDILKISANLGGVFSDSEEAQITTTGGKTINVKVLPNNNSALGSVLSSFGSFSFNLPPGVPASLRITDLSLNSQGLTVKAAATNATFSK